MKTFISISLLFLLTISFTLQGQKNATRDFIEERIGTQLDLYPQEKLHVQLDRTQYVPNEKIWFKAYLADAHSHKAVTDSRYVYVELINPLDSVVSRVRIRPENDMYYGYISLPEDLPEGTYILRAYTRYMENMGNEGFYRRNIYVGNLMANRIKPHISFRPDNEGKKVLVDLYYTEGENQIKIKPNELRFRNDKGIMQSIRMDKDSVAHISFDSKRTDKPNAFFVEADNYSHYIHFPSEEYDFDVTFFPEGGYLLDGKPCRLAFKALNTTGRAEAVNGVIVDEEGNELYEFSSYYAGMGVVGFLSEEGKKYYAECTNDKGIMKRFELPATVSGTYSLVVNWRNEKLHIGVNYPANIKRDESLYVLIHCKGLVYYFSDLKKENDFVSFYKDQFPAGVLQIVLFDARMNALSERLVFCNRDDHAVTDFVTDQSVYKTREKVTGRLRVTDNKGQPLSGNLSVAITDDADLAVDTSSTILSTLLLSSEIRGYIESPEFYLGKDQISMNAADLLMMTQGWRRYNIPEVIKGNYTYPVHPVEMSQRLSGSVKSLALSKPIANGEVSFLGIPSSMEDTYVEVTQTDEKGNFYLSGFELPDSTRIFVQSLNNKGKQSVELIVDPELFPLIEKIDRVIQPEKEQPVNDYTDSYIEKAEKRSQYDDDMRLVRLGVVNVTASRIKKDEDYSMYAGSASASVTAEDIEKRHPSNMEALFWGIPGVSYVKGQIQIRNAANLAGPVYATILVDDIPVLDEDILDILNVHDVERVDIFKGAQAAIFGVRGGGGVVNIIMKKGRTNFTKTPTYNKTVVSPLGYQRPVEFYSPRYETPEEKSSYIPDVRTTVYWKPDIITGEDGEASFDFYTSDAETTYSVVIEGLSSDGNIIREVGRIKVE